MVTADLLDMFAEYIRDSGLLTVEISERSIAFRGNDYVPIMREHMRELLEMTTVEAET